MAVCSEECQYSQVLSSRVLCRTKKNSVTRFGGHSDGNCYAILQTLNVSDDLKWTKTQPVHPYFYRSTMGFTHPNNRWTGLCMKLWLS